MYIYVRDVILWKKYTGSSGRVMSRRLNRLYGIQEKDSGSRCRYVCTYVPGKDFTQCVYYLGYVTVLERLK